MFYTSVDEGQAIMDTILATEEEDSFSNQRTVGAGSTNNSDGLRV